MDDKDAPGCPHDTSGGGIGRTFLTDADVTDLTSAMMDVAYVASQWDDMNDFFGAVKAYWDAHAPSDRICTFSTGSCTGGVFYNYYRRGSTTMITVIPKK